MKWGRCAALAMILGQARWAAAQLPPADGELLPGSSEAAALWWASSGWKIGPEQPPPKKRGETVSVAAARGEVEAVQLVVRPEKELSGFTAQSGALRSAAGEAIAAENVEILRVRYVPVAQPTDPTGSAGPWPDPLPPLQGPIDLAAGRNQPLWVRVKVPRGARAGDYAGAIRLSTEGYRAEAALRLHVFDFELPERMRCATAFGFSPENVWHYQKLKKPEERRAVLEKYWESFSAHHISPYDPAPLDPFHVAWPEAGALKVVEPGALKPAFDWKAWDRAMERAIGHYRFNSFSLPVPGLGGGTFHSRVEPSLLGFGEKTPQYQALFTAWCREAEAHLREKGWLDEAFVYWFDEPEPKDYEFVMNGFRKLKEAAPGLPRMLTEEVQPQLVGGPDIWCPISPAFNLEEAEKRRARGERFWWYVCTGPKAPYATLFIDHPAVELRVWLWQTWQRKIDGILIWQTNYWTSDAAYPDPAAPQNPYEDPMGWVSGYSTPKGTKHAWGNGDGRFIYPPEAAASGRQEEAVLAGPVDSIRWEMLRDGIEDYEYLALLLDLLRERGEKLEPGERERLAKLLEVPESITRDMAAFTKDPAPIEVRRRAVAEAVEKLARLAPVKTARAAGPPSPAPEVLKSLRAGHPRLYATREDVQRLKESAGQDPVLMRWKDRLEERARKMLSEPTAVHQLIGPRLLHQSRAALGRISALAGLFLLDGDRKKAERARAEMLAAAAFPDWNPSHFLDTAEMSHALAIGYDWLFDFLSSEERAAVRAALIEKGLKPGLKAYASKTGWTRTHNNWSQVCNGGLTVAALAIADEEPALAEDIILKARESIVTPMRMFAPDGGCEEGPGYWNYATSYNVFYLAALESALGTDFGLKAMPGFAETGLFRIHTLSPAGLAFNYADAGEGAGSAAQMLWLARQFKRPEFSRHETEIARDRPEIFHLLWRRLEDGEAPALPLDALFRGVQAACFRGALGDPKALFVGFKGGDNRASHSHLDLGAFVLDAQGERWAVDLGPDDYNLPGYFGKERWSYYRLRTEGHNTLVLDGANQELAGKAPLIAFLSTPARAFAVADLTGGYASKATRVRRGIAVLERRQVLVQDELEASPPIEAAWSLHTKAKVEVRGAAATLTRNGAALEARLLSPEGARFEVLPANPPVPQAQQPEVVKLAVRLPGMAQGRIAVLFLPAGEKPLAATIEALEPLDEWIAAGKL